MIISIVKSGIVGIIVFTLLLVLMSKTGLASAVRDNNGKFKKELNWKSILAVLVSLTVMFGLLYVGNMSLANTLSESPGFLKLFLNSFCIFLVIHIYDLVVLDYLIIVKWHPKFLKLPNTDYYTTMKPHYEGFIKGLPFGVIASLIVSLISLLRT